jgi:hypothetical protein
MDEFFKNRKQARTRRALQPTICTQKVFRGKDQTIVRFPFSAPEKVRSAAPSETRGCYRTWHDICDSVLSKRRVRMAPEFFGGQFPRLLQVFANRLPPALASGIDTEHSYDHSKDISAWRQPGRAFAQGFQILRGRSPY